MINKTQGSDVKPPLSSNRWVAGMVAGQLLGLAAAVLSGGSVPAVLGMILIGGLLGGMAARQKPKKAAVPRRDKHIRAYVFQALAETSKKLDEIIIDEEFNGAAGGGESDRRAMKTATPKLNIPMPAPPKMGGM
jgi:hypothetical protein